MKFLALALLVCGSASALAGPNCGGKLGACPSNFPEYTGPIVAGPEYPAAPTGGREGKPAGNGPAYMGCEEGRMSIFRYTIHEAGSSSDSDVVESVVCHDNEWVFVRYL
jgi:hypothetical protein